MSLMSADYNTTKQATSWKTKSVNMFEPLPWFLLGLLHIIARRGQSRLTLLDRR